MSLGDTTISPSKPPLLCPSHPTLPMHLGHVQGEVLKEGPDVVAGVDLLHLHLRVHVAVVDKVHIGHLHLSGRGKGAGTIRGQSGDNQCRAPVSSWPPPRTSVMQSSWVTTRTTSSRGSRDVHLISV